MKVHHTAICTSDFDRSLTFWRDGLGFVEQMDQRFEGDWPTLFGAPDRFLHSIFLGDPSDSDAGIIELVDFDGGLGPASPPPPGPVVGFLLVSLFTEVDATLERLGGLGLGGTPRRIELPGPVHMAVVHDPNGVAVELIGTTGSSRQRP